MPPSLTPTQVLLRIHAVALNYRDVAMLQQTYPAQVLDRGIPASDCAGEIVALAEKVTEFKVGDRAAPCFDLASLTGEGVGGEMSMVC